MRLTSVPTSIPFHDEAGRKGPEEEEEGEEMVREDGSKMVAVEGAAHASLPFANFHRAPSSLVISKEPPEKYARARAFTCVCVRVFVCVRARVYVCVRLLPYLNETDGNFDFDFFLQQPEPADVSTKSLDEKNHGGSLNE